MKNKYNFNNIKWDVASFRINGIFIYNTKNGEILAKKFWKYPLKTNETIKINLNKTNKISINRIKDK